METANLHHWVIEGQRNPHLGVFQQASSVRRNAHNRVTPAVERQSLAGDRQDSAETPSPQTLADHCHPRQAELLFFRREGTALNRLDTEGSKEIGGDVRGDDPFRLGVAGQVVRTRHHRRKLDRKSTRLNSSHSQISYAVFCLKKKKKKQKKKIYKTKKTKKNQQ